jgi:WD40 repeat protein
MILLLQRNRLSTMTVLTGLAALVAGAQQHQSPGGDSKLYRAAIAAADGALRLHEAGVAQYWLREAPQDLRGWEWRYLNALANQSQFAFKAHDAPITGLAINRTGDRLATTSGDKMVKVWDTASGSLAATLQGSGSSTWSPAFRPSGPESIVAAMSSDGSVRVWDVKTGSEVRKYEKVGNGMGAVGWSPNGRLLAAASWTVSRETGVRGWLHLWDFEQNALLWKAEYGVKPITSLAFHPSGEWFTAATWDAWLGNFAVSGNGKPAAEWKHTADDGTYPALQSVQFSPDGSTVAVASKDNLVRIHDSRTLSVARTLAGHARWANGVVFGPQGKWLASASSDETLRVWSPQPDERLPLAKVLHGATSSLNAVAVSPVGSTIYTGAADGTIHIWDAARHTDLSRDTLRHTKDVYGMTFTPDGNSLVTATWGGDIRLWDAQNGRVRWHKVIHKTSANAVALSPDGRSMISGGNDGALKMTDAETGEVRATWESIDNGRAAGIAWSPNSRWVFCPSSRPSGKVWNAATGKMHLAVSGGKGEIYSASFSPDSKLLAVGWTGGELRLIDPETGEDRAQIPLQSGGVFATAFHPNGKVLATAGGNRRIALWEIPTGKLIRNLEGHAELIYSLSFSPDGSRLASGSTDQTVRLWDASTGEAMLAIPFPVQVYAVTFSPDNRKLAVAPMDGTVRILEAPSPARLQRTP